MNQQLTRRGFLRGSAAAVGVGLLRFEAFAAEAKKLLPPGARGWLIYVDGRLGAAGRAMQEKITAAGENQPLLQAISEAQKAKLLAAGAPVSEQAAALAFNHLIVVALPGDPMLEMVWQREATIADGSLYVFGFGNLAGSLGYIESDRNPFLHAADVAKAPYEAELITLTGTDAAGLELAVDAFTSRGLCNGIVGMPGQWKRTSTTLLDRDPLIPTFNIPEDLPRSLGPLLRIAVNQASEEEYRGVLQDTGVEPVSIWRAKYYAKGQWEAPGEIASFHNYAAGLHRRAYGNTVWAGTFTDEATAAAAAPKIAKAAGLQANNRQWQGRLPAYAWGAPTADAPTTGSLNLWVEGRTVLMAALLDPPNMTGGPC